MGRILTVKDISRPKPELMLSHTPGFIHELDTNGGCLTLFESSQPDFGLDFKAEIVWNTHGEPHTSLSFYMEPSGILYWQFSGWQEVGRLTNHVADLEKWLDDIGTVCAHLRHQYPLLPIAGIPSEENKT